MLKDKLNGWMTLQIVFLLSGLVLIANLFPHIQILSEQEATGRSNQDKLEVIQQIKHSPTTSQHMLLTITGETHSPFQGRLRPLSQACGLPILPAVSMDKPSEKIAIKEMNQWIECHNRWSELLRGFAQDSQARPYQASLQFNAKEWEDLAAEEQKLIRQANSIYTEWKRNSERLKQQLSFRRQLYSETHSN